MLFFLTVLFALGRIFSFLIPAGLALNSFKAFAHIYVGGLFGSYFATGNKYHKWLAIGISLLELVVFILGNII